METLLCNKCGEPLKVTEEEGDASDLFPWLEKGRPLTSHVIEPCDCKAD